MAGWNLHVRRLNECLWIPVAGKRMGCCHLLPMLGWLFRRFCVIQKSGLEDLPWSNPVGLFFINIYWINKITLSK